MFLLVTLSEEIIYINFNITKKVQNIIGSLIIESEGWSTRSEAKPLNPSKLGSVQPLDSLNTNKSALG